MEYLNHKRRRNVILTLGVASFVLCILSIALMWWPPETLITIRKGLFIMALANAYSTAAMCITMAIETRSKEKPIT